MNGKGMAKLIRTRASPALGRLEPQLTQKPADDIGCRSDRQPRGVQAKKERLWIRPAKIAHQSLSLRNVSCQRRLELAAFNRLGTPEDIAEVVTWLATDEARWVTGQNIRANGGLS